MNKSIVRTSVVWLLILGVLAGSLIYRYGPPGMWRLRRSTGASVASGELQPEAAGPSAAKVQNSQPAPGKAGAAAASPPIDAPVQLSPERMQSIGVTTGEVRYEQVGEDVRATGTVDLDERLLSYVQVRFPGYIHKVFANATYQYVHVGQPLFTIYSPELVATQEEWLLARRNQAILGKSTVDGVAAGANALAAAAEQRLQQWQVPQNELNQIAETGKAITNLSIDSPVAGYITERNALPNMYVEPSTRLYTVADLSRIWVYAQVFQDDVGRIRPGDPAEITADAYPGRVFPANVETILPQVDLATRTVRVRLALANPAIRLKPGMFVNVTLKSRTARSLVIPATAVLQSGTRQMVFLDTGGGHLVPKEVSLGARAGDDFVVLSGLKEHQTVVTSANFLIDSESQLQAAAGSFRPPAPGAGKAPAGAASAAGPGADIQLSTDPNPAQRGNNTLRVKVADAKGVPVAGADVSVTFYMPAMPAMGMSAMNMTTKLSDKGNGTYEGSGQLDSGGTWQVTVTVQKGGQLLAVKQFRVNATGGM